MEYYQKITMRKRSGLTVVEFEDAIYSLKFTIRYLQRDSDKNKDKIERLQAKLDEIYPKYYNYLCDYRRGLTQPGWGKAMPKEICINAYGNEY